VSKVKVLILKGQPKVAKSLNLKGQPRCCQRWFERTAKVL